MIERRWLSDLTLSQNSLPRVYPSEFIIVAIILLAWLCAIGVFVNKWAKIQIVEPSDRYDTRHVIHNVPSKMCVTSVNGLVVPVCVSDMASSPPRLLYTLSIGQFLRYVYSFCYSCHLLSYIVLCS